MRKENGITLTALTITIIVLLLLAGVALSIVMGENNIFKTTENAVEQNNKVQVKEKIELAIMEKQLEEKREVSLDEIIDKLIEKEITTEEESDREIGTVITEEGYLATIKEKEEGGWEVIIGEKGTARIRLNISKTPEILTSKVTIKIEGRLIGIGLKELVMPDGSKKEYEEGITKIEETYEVTANGTYKFVLIGRDGQKAEEEIEINNILEGVIAINPSEIEWTNEEITIEVIYPIGSEELIKEIKIGEEEWKEYKGEEKISENTTIRARIRNTEETITTASLTITNIDKLAPNTFTPEVSVTSNSITISGKTTDKEATSTNGSSGIVGYYYSKDGGSSWQTNTNPLTESYTYTGLSQGISYPLKMKAVDKAGNETVIDIGNKTTTNIAGLGTITIKPSTTTPTNQDIKVNVTWPSNTEGLTKQISINNGSTWSTYTGEVTISSNCTVKARLIDSINQTGTTASLTITNIDKTNPTVTATAGTETITEGDSNEISKYFTWQANGIYGITSVVYTDTSNNNTVVTNTNTLAEGTHVIKCTVTKETGATASATKLIIVEDRIVNATEIANNPSKHYGGYVTNYTTPSGDPDVGWRIFYADESNIYLIADDYIHYDYCPVGAKGTAVTRNSDYKLSFDNVYNDYTGSANITDTRIKKWIQKYLDVAPSSTNTNIRAVAFMLDETRWSVKYANPSYAEYAIGGPTLEMFVASYNKEHPEKPMYCSANSTGYYISWSNGGTDYYISGLDKSESLYVISDTSKASAMWVGSPSASDTYSLVYVYYSGNVGYSYFYIDRTPGFRPIVCLNSDIQLEKQSDGTYLIK